MLVEEPTVSAVEVLEIVTAAVVTAAPKLVAPVGGSMVLVPVPARLRRVNEGLYAWIVTEAFEEI